jgi:hypothetical protein
LRGTWLYETTHLCLPDVPQPWKNVTPEFLDERFSRLMTVSNGRLWAATPDDVIDYELLRRNLTIDNVRRQSDAVLFDVGGRWPVGVCNSRLTLRISGLGTTTPPRVQQSLLPIGGYDAGHDQVLDVRQSDDDWLVTLQLAPHRTVHVLSGTPERGGRSRRFILA